MSSEKYKESGYNDLVTISYKSHVLYPMTSGLVEISNHLRPMYPTSILQNLQLTYSRVQLYVHYVHVATTLPPDQSVHLSVPHQHAMCPSFSLAVADIIPNLHLTPQSPSAPHFTFLEFQLNRPLSSSFSLLIGDSKLVVLLETVDLVGF